MNQFKVILEDLFFVLDYEISNNNELKLLKWDINFTKNSNILETMGVNEYLSPIEKSFKAAYNNWFYKNMNFAPDDIEKFLVKNYTLKQSKIYESLSKTMPGSTMCYQELANTAGFKNGYARFAGTCMAQNNYPLMVPCHRIIAKNGKMEAFSASGGVPLKKFLLEIEAKKK